MAPAAFGFCSIVGMFVILSITDFLDERFSFHVSPFDGFVHLVAVGPLVGMRGVAIAFLIYFIPGAIGASFAVLIVNRATSLYRKMDRRGVGGG